MESIRLLAHHRPTSALLALVLSFALLLLARELHWRHYRSLSHVILNIGATILAIPTLVLAIGLFILLREIDFLHTIFLGLWYAVTR